MFSQFRNAVEQLEQLATSQISNAGKWPANTTSGSTGTSSQHSGIQEVHRSPNNSIDETRKTMTSPTPSQLAESALSNFRKTLLTSRSGSPAPSYSPEKEHAQPHARSGRTLEERLRASFVIGDSSEKTTPQPSKIATPVAERPEIDPVKIELPRSPVSHVRYLSPESIPSENEILRELTPPKMDQHTNQQETLSVESSSHEGNDLSNAKVIDISMQREMSPDTLIDAAISVKNPLADMQEGNVPSTPTMGVTEITEGPRSEVYTPQDPTEGSVSNYHSLPVSPQSSSSAEEATELERVRERLRVVEQRFADISVSFKRLQSEKSTADQVLKTFTPVESISDTDGLRDHLKNLQLKIDLSVEEIQNLNHKSQLYDERLQDLRDTHRLESASQSKLIDSLRSQLSDAEARVKLKAEEAMSYKTNLDKSHSELEKLRTALKDEEEKGSKAISLLKTVRTKLVKAEKERDEAIKEVNVFKDKLRDEAEREKQEKLRLEQELDRLRGERDREITALKSQLEREAINLKERHDMDLAARKSQYELEAITTKAVHTKEVSAKMSRITVLETSLRNITKEKDSLFDQLQLRQAELESSQSHLDLVEARASELQHQLREADARMELLTDELAESRDKALNGGASHTSAEELARILSDTENRYELKLSEVRGQVRGLERERQRAEDEWSRNLQERSRELERLRDVLGSKEKEYSEFLRMKSDIQNQMNELQTENRKLQLQKETEGGILAGLQTDIQQLKETHATLMQEKDEVVTRSQSFEKLLEEAKSREQTLKISNKTLKDELRKVQASATLLEKHRNPGVGFWSTARSNGFAQSAVDLQLQSPKSPTQASRTSVDEGSTSSTRPGSPVPAKNDEEINLEYIRNVILQFLEHKEMRPNLVRVLSIILHFTPQETRRLIAKV